MLWRESFAVLPVCMNAFRLFWLVLLAVSLGGCQSLYFGAVNALSPSGPIERTSYTFDPAHGLALDVYRSQHTSDQAPVLVFLYGGSWRSGQKSWYRFVGESLAAKGLVVVIPDYRTYPRGQFPDFIDDAALALRYTRDHAQQWGGSRNHLFLAGHSAGAHIALLLATDAKYLQGQQMQPQELAGVIGIAGAYDFAPFNSRRLLQAFPGPTLQALTQPITFVDGDEPSILLLHGTNDDTVWPRNSERLADRLRSQKMSVELRLYADIGHSGIVRALGKRNLDLAPTRADLLHFIETQNQVDGAKTGRK